MKHMTDTRHGRDMSRPYKSRIGELSRCRGGIYAARRSSERGSAVLRALLWVLVGAVVMLLLVVDPLGVSPVDGWLGIQNVSEDDGHERGHGRGAELWTCGMHPEVIQEEPGICPICHMDLTRLRMDDSIDDAAEHAGRGEGLFTCPMHPDILEEEPGSCPICGMDLVPTKGESDPVEGDREILFYRNPMDPSITSPVPRKDEMGMDYVPVYAEDAESVAADGVVVTIDPMVQQNMNVVTRRVQRRDIAHKIRTVGYLDYDQERMVSVTTKYPGFIEKTYVNHIGQPIQKGQPLFEIYSPELVQTEQELLAAVRYVRNLSSAPEDARGRAEALLEAARQRLRYWDISVEQIRQLEETGEVFRTLQVAAPANGVIMKRMPGLEGMATKPGMELLHIADLSNLWLTVEIFDEQLPWLDTGSSATVTLSYFPGVTYRGRVRYIEPEVSEKTRTIQLTLDVPNRDRRLRVGMYATVVFEPVAATDVITVPAESIIRTGERDIVVVALGDGRFAPRDVILGPRSDGFIQVLEGLSDGDEIVTSAQFLIDSESNHVERDHQ
ncbi:MAG: efflux RND transporter periplasmic adaptor subunit [Acidobacteria bacterium]|nr:efflux RND transporter periplasmic adaptor subunit [Candidatus Sulfomarinibacter kjeldsenii]